MEQLLSEDLRPEGAPGHSSQDIDRMIAESRVEGGDGEFFVVEDTKGKVIVVVVYIMMVYEYFMVLYFGIWK
jgi:hypothetical protein